MGTKPWYKAKPDLLDKETKSLDNVGISYELDSHLDSQNILKINLVIESTNPAFNLAGLVEPIRLEAIYPDNYPYFRPEVIAPDLDLPRHQNPFGKQLCLLPRPSQHWEPEWTLADLLKEQLSKVLSKGAIIDPGILAADPDEQAEPASDYYETSPHPILFDSSPYDHIETPTKELNFLGKFSVGIPGQTRFPSRMAVLESYDSSGHLTYQLPNNLKKHFPISFNGLLLRLKKRPPHGNASQDYQWLKKLVGAQNTVTSLNRQPKQIGQDLYLNCIVGLNFPEEIEPGKYGLGWLFLVVTTTMVQHPNSSKKKPARIPLEEAYYYKVARLSTEDLQIRVPKLAALPQKKVAMVGLGALGAPVALELARNQVGQLRIMDFDVVEPATTVRWPLGLAASGLFKTEAIKSFIDEHYPRTDTITYNHRIGGIRGVVRSESEKVRTEQQIMDDLLTEADLLFDATAEPGINHYLSSLARDRSIPYVSMYATPGAWGGLVMRVVPGKTEGCWMCLQYHKWTNRHLIPVKDNSGDIQAAGCGDLTFTGASFDLQNVALTGVRLVITTLLSGVDGGYPDTDWDVGILKLMDGEATVIAPTWETQSLVKHPDCPYCKDE
ncbi:ThiF family adenylyltransferase [Nibrella saemangeumensis]